MNCELCEHNVFNFRESEVILIPLPFRFVEPRIICKNESSFIKGQYWRQGSAAASGGAVSKVAWKPAPLIRLVFDRQRRARHTSLAIIACVNGKPATVFQFT